MFEEFLRGYQIKTVDEITLDHLHAFRDSRAVSPRTWIRDLEVLRHFLRFSKKSKWLAENIAEDIPMPKNLKPSPREPYEPNEVKRMVAATEAIGKAPYERLRARAMLLLLRYAALRISDVALMRKNRIRDGEIFIRTAKNGKPVKLPLHPELEAALNVLPEPRNAEEGCPYFFWSGKGTERTAIDTASSAPAFGARHSLVLLRGATRPASKCILWQMRVRNVVFLGVVLTAFALALGAQQNVPPVFLNHLTIIVPSAVYAQFQQSQFLRNEFGNFQERTNTSQTGERGSNTYTGIYILGRHTYLELFESGKVLVPGAAGPWQAGGVLFNMSIDDRNQLPLIRDRAAAEAGAPMRIETTRNPANNNSPTYDTARPDTNTVGQSGIAVSAVVKGYYPDGITREGQMQRRKTYLPDRLLHDVSGISVTVNKAELEGLLQWFRAFGYAIRTEGDKQIASGPDITFTLLPEKPGTPRTLAVDLSLNRGKTGAEMIPFANDYQIQFHGSSATWTFKFPGN